MRIVTSQFLLAILTFIAILPPAIAQERYTVRVNDIMNAPETFRGGHVVLTGMLSVLKEDTKIFDKDVTVLLDADIAFAPGWDDRTPESLVQTLTRMRAESNTTFPEPGLTVMTLHFRRAEFVLVGTLIENPDFKPAPNYTEPSDIILHSDEYECQFTCKYRFEIDRILELRER